jgi:hypothetical protein
MYSEPADRQIQPLKISNLQRCWLKGFSNSVPKVLPHSNLTDSFLKQSAEISTSGKQEAELPLV